jgi:hypothetical protein
MSDSGSPQNPVASAGAALSIAERAAEPVLTDLRAAHRGAAEVLARALRDQTLSAHLTPKAVSALATELLASLAAPAADHAD